MLTFMAVHLFKFRFAVAEQYWRSTDFGHHWFHVARVHDHSPLPVPWWCLQCQMRWSTRRPVSNSILATGKLGPDHAKDPVTHNNSETGDTVGDPLKDTSGSKMNIVKKLNAMCGVVVDVFAGAVRRKCDNHRSLLAAVREIAETWKQSAATGILNCLALDYLSTIIPVVGLDITFLTAHLCVARSVWHWDPGVCLAHWRRADKSTSIFTARNILTCCQMLSMRRSVSHDAELKSIGAQIDVGI